MIQTGNIVAVAGFEVRRALTRTRLLWWALLALFPVAITSLAQLGPARHGEEIPRHVWAAILFLLCPLAVSMLGVFLYTSPAVAVELERKSWVYLAVRPYASRAVLFGKYAVAVAWTAAAALTGLSISVLIARPERAFELWWGLARLVLLSCPAYGAMYLLLGVIFYKRAMIVAIAYTLLFELAASFIPAMVNKLTIQFRLRALLFDFADLPKPKDDATARQVFGDSPPETHLWVLLGYTLALLIASQLWLARSEFTSADEATT